ncbi:RNF14 [Branchiostoma lanceolatum]|uniref:E3 ubiquitin-protein ligase RNF14 n=1 Tax=Branchiostoma lanceolatum TaxID=7740 RepID=A0A8K0A227_BRALA|nr:RNF14 [Branchiostoma lanceolatum]
MSDQEAQENELLALSSIYDDTVFMAAEDGTGGQFCSILDLPENFQIKAPAPPGESVNKATVFLVKYLPPIILHFQYPADYPSCSAPQFTLSCKWLTLQQLTLLCKHLDELWTENSGMEILFTWAQYLQEEALITLGISDVLDVTWIEEKVKLKNNRRQRVDEQKKTDAENTKDTGTVGASGQDLYKEKEGDEEIVKNISHGGRDNFAKGARGRGRGRGRHQQGQSARDWKGYRRYDRGDRNDEHGKHKGSTREWRDEEKRRKNTQYEGNKTQRQGRGGYKNSGERKWQKEEERTDLRTRENQQTDNKHGNKDDNIIGTDSNEPDLSVTLVETYDEEKERETTKEVGDPRAIQDLASPSLLVPAIVEYDQERRQHMFNTTMYNCNVCFGEKLGADCIGFKGCDHVYCKECMKGYFQVQISEGNVQCLQCPEPKCESQALPSQVQELVGGELFARYDRLLLQSSLDGMADVVYCPRKSCQCPVMLEPDSKMGGCTACQYTFCTLCKLAYHGVSPCRIKPDDLRKLREEYLAASDEGKKFLEKRYGRKSIKQALEETFSEEWLKRYAKECPQCGTHIQKLDGCNKMTCIKCRAYFCWLCGMLLHHSNPYGHFNKPGSKCFNLLFQGMEEGEGGEEGEVWEEGFEEEDDWDWIVFA